MIARTEPFPKEKVDPKADPMNPIWDDAATTHVLDVAVGAHLTVEVQDMAHKARPARRASVTPAPDASPNTRRRLLSRPALMGSSHPGAINLTPEQIDKYTELSLIHISEPTRPY